MIKILHILHIIMVPFKMGPNATDPLNELQSEVQRERNPKWFKRS